MVEKLDFKSRPIALDVADEHAEYVADSNDKRTTVVPFTDDIPDSTLENLEAKAMALHAEDDEPALQQIELTEQEKRDLDFSRDGVSVVGARYLKGLGEEYGVDPFQHVDPGEIDGVADARPILERARRSGGINRGGGAEYDDEAAEREERQRRQGAEKYASKECGRAEDYCEDGDEAACEYLVDECGLAREEAERMMGLSDEPTTADTEQTNLVTVGDGGDSIDVTPEQAGALRRSWQGYKGAVSEIEDALNTLRERTTDARRAMQAINGIRNQHGQGDTDPERLNELLAEADRIPGSIPEPRRLDQYGEQGGEQGGVSIDKFGGDPETAADRFDQRQALSDPRSREQLVRALRQNPPETWGVESWKMHPTSAVANVRIDSEHSLQIRLDSRSSVWTTTHYKSGPDHQQRLGTDATEAVNVAERAVQRIKRGEPAFPKAPADLETTAANEPPMPMPDQGGDGADAPTTTISMFDDESGEMKRIDAPVEVDGWRLKLDPADARGVAVWEGAGDRYVAISKPGSGRFAVELETPGVSRRATYPKAKEAVHAVEDVLGANDAGRRDQVASVAAGNPETAADRFDQRRQAGGAIYDAEDRGRIKHHAVVNPNIASLFRSLELPDMLARQLSKTEGWQNGRDMIEGRSSDPADWMDLNGVGPARAEKLGAAASIIREKLAEDAAARNAAAPSKFGGDPTTAAERFDQRRQADSAGRGDVIETDDQRTIGGGRANPQATLAGGEQGERGQGEAIETVEENPGGLMADERDTDTTPDPSETEQGGLEDVGVSEGLRDAQQGTLGGSDDSNSDDGTPPGFGPAEIPDPKIRNLQDAIDHLNTWTDGYGDRVSMDANLKRQFDAEGINPGIWNERQSQDLFRYGIDQVDFLRRWADDAGVEPDRLDQHADAIVAFAQDHAAENRGGSGNGR